MSTTESPTLKDALAARTREGVLYNPLPEGWVHCYACGHNCRIPLGRDGICRVRFNRDGKLMVPWGYVGGIQLDPVEKKPFFHAFPGALAMSFGMLGCDFHCAYCQNWVTSQALRDPAALSPPQDVTPEQFADLAVGHGAKIVTSTYNEPLITSEWAVEVFRAATARGLVGSYVSNGNGTPGVLDYIRPWVDLYKVDLKGFDDRNYRKLGGVLQNVLDTIRMLKERRFWVEIVTLIVPGFNDADAELRSIAEFLVSVDSDIPWHVTAFHSDYRMSDKDNTAARRLVTAAEIGLDAGLRFVYAGNLPGQVGPHENTWCPGCRELLVERRGFKVLRNRISKGRCPRCGREIPGIWSRQDLERLRPEMASTRDNKATPQQAS